MNRVLNNQKKYSFIHVTTLQKTLYNALGKEKAVVIKAKISLLQRSLIMQVNINSFQFQILLSASGVLIRHYFYCRAKISMNYCGRNTKWYSKVMLAFEIR